MTEASGKTEALRRGEGSRDRRHLGEEMEWSVLDNTAVVLAEGIRRLDLAVATSWVVGK
jgi:hypothetical protein